MGIFGYLKCKYTNSTARRAARDLFVAKRKGMIFSGNSYDRRKARRAEMLQMS